MPVHAAAGIIFHHCKNEHMQRMFLPLSARIGRPSADIESAFVTNPDTCQVISLGVRSDPFDGTGGFDVPIFADIEVFVLKKRRTFSLSIVKQRYDNTMTTCRTTTDYTGLRRNNKTECASQGTCSTSTISLTCAGVY